MNLNNKKTLKNSICYAGTDNKGYTCYNKENLKKIAVDWNNHIKHNLEGGKITLKNSKNNNEEYLLIDFNDNTTEKELWNKLNVVLSKNYNCKNEICWSSLPFIKNKINLLKRFKPFKPSSWYKNNRTWLNTHDIENVMEQYQEKYNDFKFLGVSPVDYNYLFSDNECVTEELCKLNLKDLYDNNIRRLGVVFNLDKHDQSGSHWVALFSDMNKREVYYYDSYGIRPPYYINHFMYDISNQGIKIPVQIEKKDILPKGTCIHACNKEDIKPFTCYFNDIRHQFKNSECGVYSMHFIISFLEGKDFVEIIEDIINDDDMNKKRDIYYINKNNIDLE